MKYYIKLLKTNTIYKAVLNINFLLKFFYIKNVWMSSTSIINPLFSFALIAIRMAVKEKNVSTTFKAKIVECKNHKSGSLMICALESGEEVAVYVNIPDFTPFSRNVSLKKEGEYYRYRQVVTTEDNFELASKFGVILKA
jgi:hypothetical protein